MGFDTKTIQELEELARNLSQQVERDPTLFLEQHQLEECRKWIAILRGDQRPKTAA